MRADAEEVLAALLHDVRSPLGVAHGYVRMIREGRLPTDADRDRALEKTRDALGRMTELCNDATAGVVCGGKPQAVAMPAVEFVNAVRAQLDSQHAVLVCGDIAPLAIVHLETDPMVLVDGVVGVLLAWLHARRDAMVRAETRSATLVFLSHDRTAGSDDSVVVSLPLETVSA